MPVPDRWSGAILFIMSLGMAYMSRKLPLGSLRKPGAGFFPLFLAFALAFLALLLFFGSWFKRTSKEFMNDQEIRIDSKKAYYVLGALLAYDFSFQRLGFILSTIIFFLLLKPVVEKKWPYVLLGAILVTMLSYLVFEIILECQLPKGVLGI